jgi:uncharacterized protein (TIGR03437 family)
MKRINIAGHIALTTLLGGAFGAVVFAQTTPVGDQPVVITVETTDATLYRSDTFDVTKIAKTPGLTTSVNQAFVGSVNIGDIRTINGQPAKGIWSYQVVMALPIRANPQPGQFIADVDSAGFFQCVWQFVSLDGKYIGTLYDAGASPSPDHAVMGGSGAFLGATGVHEMMQTVTAMRGASTSEDPANRRINGGGKVNVVFTLYPKSRPTVVSTPSGPAVVHSDGKLVSSANPAQAGEVLTLYATGLGPTTPAVSSGQPFPTGALSTANATIEVLVNGQSSGVLYAGGYPGAVNGYQVNFRLPAALGAGNAALHLTAAWIPGPDITIATK